MAETKTTATIEEYLEIIYMMTAEGKIVKGAPCGNYWRLAPHGDGDFASNDARWIDQTGCEKAS